MRKISNFISRASFVANLLRAKIEHKKIPLTVIYNIINKCNAQCRYCYAGYYKRQKKEPSINEIFLTIDQLHQMGNRRISLSGGEPLLRRDIGEIINYIKSKGIMCTLNSNGFLVSQKINELKNLDVLCLSLDGSREQHDYYRGAGSFDKVMVAIDSALNHGIRLYTNTVLHHKNLNSIDFIMDLAVKKGFGVEFNLLIDHIYESGQKDIPRKASNEEYRAAIKKIIDYKNKNYPIVMSEKTYRYVLEWADYGKEDFKRDENPDFPYANCTMAGRYFCCIDTDGKLYACPHLIDKKNALSCYEHGVKKAFQLIEKPDCHACYQVYHNEFNLLFNFDPGVILNYTKSFFNFVSRKF